MVSGNGQPQPGRILPARPPARCGQGTRPLWTRDAQPHRLWGPHGLHWPRRKADWVKAAGGNSEEVAGCAPGPRVGPRSPPARRSRTDARTVGRRALVVTVGTAPATPRSATASGVKSFRNQSFRILLLPLLNPDAGPRAAGCHKARAGTPPLRRTGPPGCKGTPIPRPPEARAQHARDRGKNRSRIEALR